MIDAAVAAGANRVGGLQFSFAKQDELLRSALEKAGADAHAQAESVARGLGVRLKGVVSATTAGRPVPVQPRMEAMALGEARAAPTPIEPGEATVSATLQVTYAIAFLLVTDPCGVQHLLPALHARHHERHGCRVGSLGPI